MTAEIINGMTFGTTDNPAEAYQDKKVANIARIRILLEEGKSTEEIATDLKTTVNSLRTFCSKNSISLRLARQIRAEMEAEAAKAEAEASGNTPSTEKSDKKQFLVSLRIRYKGKTKNIDLDLPVEKVALLFLDASLRSVSVDDVLAKLLVKTMEVAIE